LFSRPVGTEERETFAVVDDERQGTNRHAATERSRQACASIAGVAGVSVARETRRMLDGVAAWDTP
jgi:hypothetical protein